MELLKLLLAPHATPTLAAMAEAGLLGAVLGGVPYLASFENMVKVEAAIGARRMRCAGSARSALGDGGRRAAWQRLRLCQRRIRAAARRSEGWWRDVAGVRTDRRRARCSIGSGREPSPIARCSPGRARKRARTTTPGATLATLAAALDRAGFSAQGRGFHRPRRGRRAGARRGAARGGRGVDRRRFSRRPRRNGRDCQEGAAGSRLGRLGCAVHQTDRPWPCASRLLNLGNISEPLEARSSALVRGAQAVAAGHRLFPGGLSASKASARAIGDYRRAVRFPASCLFILRLLGNEGGGARDPQPVSDRWISRRRLA